MSALVDSEIDRAITHRSIIIEPFDEKCLGTNSYDVHLAKTLKIYKVACPPIVLKGDLPPEKFEEFKRQWMTQTESSRSERRMIRDAGIESVDFIPGALDCRAQNETVDIEIPEEGLVLQPNVLYLASTVEYTESHDHLPLLNGKSSIGRLGLSIHVTAGTGDVGFKGHWTMELFVIHPLRVYAGMAIGQLLWLSVGEPPDVPYDRKPSAKYNNHDPLPQASRMHYEQAHAESEK